MYTRALSTNVHETFKISTIILERIAMKRSDAADVGLRRTFKQQWDRLNDNETI